MIGGGITGDIQINDTHLHKKLKKLYREKEMIECLQQLTNDANQLPKITRDHMVQFASKSCEEVELNGESALKQLFILNALDGSEDYLVHQSLQDLVGKYQIIKEVTSRTLNLFFCSIHSFCKNRNKRCSHLLFSNLPEARSL